MKKKDNVPSPSPSASLEKRRRYVESAAAVGLMLVLLSMVVPFVRPTDTASLYWARWVYAAGALIYTVARVINVNGPNDSLRIKRLRRLEFWAGMCFIIGAAMWFYKMDYYSDMIVGHLAIIRQTVAFTMAGAVIQIVAGKMIASRMKKER